MAEQMKPSGIDWIGDIPSSWEINKVKCLAHGVCELRFLIRSLDKNAMYIEESGISLSLNYRKRWRWIL